jgi:cytochrome P450
MINLEILSNNLYFNLFVGFAAVVILFFLRIRPLRIQKSVPGIKSYPVIGFLGYAVKNWNEWPSVTAKLCHRYNKTWGGPVPNFGGLPGAYFYIHQEETLKHVLSDIDTYIKGDIWKRVLGELLGNGIFASDGEQWKVHRKLMSNMFSRNLLRHHAKVTEMKLFQIVRQFQDKIRASSNSPISIDVQDLFFRLTFDITALITFGIDLDSVGKEVQHDFPLAFDEISFLCQKRFLDPFFQVKRMLQIGKRERRIKKLKTAIDQYAFTLIQERRVNHNPISMDILSRYIDYSNKTGHHISNQDLRDVVMNIILAGRDTTACALSWTWYELSRNPHVTKRVIEEVNDICGIPDNADYSYDSMNKLRYTHCVALEVIRLHPPVCQDPRFASRDTVLPDGTAIPSGAGVDMCFFASGRSKSIWGPDALDFDPDRFLNVKEPNAFKFPMFNAGPRMCLGRPLALMNMKLAMSILLPLFDFVDINGHSGEYQWNLVEAMKGGFEVQVSEKGEDLVSNHVLL